MIARRLAESSEDAAGWVGKDALRELTNPLAKLPSRVTPPRSKGMNDEIPRPHGAEAVSEYFFSALVRRVIVDVNRLVVIGCIRLRRECPTDKLILRTLLRMSDDISNDGKRDS